MIDNILFDLDGTLTDPKKGITRCIQFSLNHFSFRVPSADQLIWCIGPPLRDSFSRILNTTDDRILDQALSQFFHAIYGSELNGRFSDKSELVAHLLESENLDSNISMIVGDRVYDIVAGKKNGIMTAAVSYGYGTQNEIALSKPDILFNAFSDLLSFLKITETPNQITESFSPTASVK